MTVLYENPHDGNFILSEDCRATAGPHRRHRSWCPESFSRITRAFGSPKTPHTVGSTRKPGKQYASHSRRLRLAIRLACPSALEALSTQ